MTPRRYIQMTKMKKLMITAAIIIAVAVVAGVTVVAVSNYGSYENPLVTLSYLTNKLAPDLLNQFDEKLNTAKTELSDGFNDKVNQFEQDVNDRLANGEVSSTTDTFSVVTLSKGQTVTCAVGAEIMLRIGTAKAAGDDSPALVDTTDASTLNAGGELKKNHMYMVTIVGNGVTATSSTVKIVIRGDYTISE